MTAPATRSDDTSPDTSAAEAGDTIRDLLRRSVARSPQATALRFEGREWTYARLQAAARRVARRLAEAGLAPGSRVAAYGGNSDAYVVLFLACAAGGFLHVPVNFGLKGGELTHILEDCEAELLVTDGGDLLERVRQVRDEGRAPRLRTVWPMRPGTDLDQESVLDTALAVPEGTSPEAAGDAETEAPAAVVRGTDLAQLLYTSGTTSAPKGAMMSHRALLAEYVSAIVALDLTPEDRPLIVMPLYHSAAMHVFLIPYLALGATVHLLPSPDIPRMLEVVEAERIGSLFLAPTVWVPLSNHPDLDTRDLRSLTKAQYGASIMPVTVLQRLRQRQPGIGFYNCFGQSEMGPLCTVLRPEEHDARPASCGRPVFHTEARVMTADGAPAAPGEPGEIQYRGPQLMSGYWNRPEATAEAFTDDGWFRSGDQVTRDAQGYIQVVDRIKDVINTGGVLVAPREVEDVVYELDEVAEVAVVGLPDERWIEAVTAVVVLKEGAELTAEGVRAHVKARLADHKVPKRVDFVAELPRNQSGKLLKRQLRAERTEEDA